MKDEECREIVKGLKELVKTWRLEAAGVILDDSINEAYCSALHDCAADVADLLENYKITVWGD
jgi:hypothetical protein